MLEIIESMELIYDKYILKYMIVFNHDIGVLCWIINQKHHRNTNENETIMLIYVH